MPSSITTPVTSLAASGSETIAYFRDEPTTDSTALDRQSRWLTAAAILGWLLAAGWYVSVLAGMSPYRFLPLAIVGLCLTQLGKLKKNPPPPSSGLDALSTPIAAVPRSTYRHPGRRRRVRKPATENAVW